MDHRHRLIGIRVGLLAGAAALAAGACDGGGLPAGVGARGAAGAGNGPIVKFDLFARPLPEVPLPNDLAMRPDPNSPTGKRVNAAVMVAPTELERDVRKKLDKLDGWGVYGSITVGFTHDTDEDLARLDVFNIRNRHAGDDFDFTNDAVYLINVDRRCRGRTSKPECAGYGKPVPIDLGEGLFPPILQEPDRYYENDPRGMTSNILFETIEEDLDGDGVMGVREDTDFDGVLDHPNTFSGRDNTSDDPDDLVTFYEFETNTLIMRPLIPLEERTTYAVVLTDDLIGVNGQPVRSPFPYFHHIDQAADLEDLGNILGDNPEYGGRRLQNVRFAWTFTTQSVRQDIIELRKGLAGDGGPFARLRDDFPPEMYVAPLWECNPSYPDSCVGENALPANTYIVRAAVLAPTLQRVAEEVFDLNREDAAPLIDSYQYVDYLIFGWTTTPIFLDSDADGWEEESWDINWKTGRGKYAKGRVNFIIVVPRDEYRIAYNERNGKPLDSPAPVVFYGHGYTAFRVEALAFAGNLAKFGLATVGWDCVHHGSALDPALRNIAMGIFSVENLHAAGIALLDDRAVDLDNDKFDGRGSDPADLGPPPCGEHPCIQTMHFDVAFGGETMQDGVKHLPGGTITDRPNVWLGRYGPYGDGTTSRWTPNVIYQDDEEDSASDFWTAYVFHTRDVVRQSALDLIRILEVFRGFDGVRMAEFDVDGDGEREAYDFNADGQPDLAGDFDGDGDVDFGGPENDYYAWGQSLGGIMSGVLGGTHPSIRAVAPVAGGGGLSDVGVRSTQGGVKEAVILRIMGPLVVTVPAVTRWNPDEDYNRTACCAPCTPPADPECAGCPEEVVSLRFIVPQGNDTGEVEIACLNTGSASDFAIAPGDVVVARNMRRPLEPRCAVAAAGGRSRLSIAADFHDPLEITIYDASSVAGWALEDAEHCTVASGARLRTAMASKGEITRIETFMVPRQTFEWHAFEQGDPLVAVAEGFGLRRGTPDLRRFLGIAQMVLDPADPAVYAPHYANSMVVATVGDMNVPVNTGIAIARTAGSLPFYADSINPAWASIDVGAGGPLVRPGGRTPNRVLLDTHTILFLDLFVPWRAPAPEAPLFDADDYSRGTDGFGQPRLDPPLRVWRPSQLGEECAKQWDGDVIERVECAGGVSLLSLPYIRPGGDHGFDLPDPDLPFDVNTYMINMIGWYFGNRATVVDWHLCMHNNSCDWIPPYPGWPAP